MVVTFVPMAKDACFSMRKELSVKSRITIIFTVSPSLNANINKIARPKPHLRLEIAEGFQCSKRLQRVKPKIFLRMRAQKIVRMPLNFMIIKHKTLKKTFQSTTKNSLSILSQLNWNLQIKGTNIYINHSTHALQTAQLKQA